MMSFLYPFMNFFQPGVFWPQLAQFKPMLVFSLLALVVGLAGPSLYPRRKVFFHPAFVWLVLFFVVQAASLMSSGIGIVLSELSYWSAYLIFVVVSLLLIRDERSLASYVRGMIAGSMFIVLFGIWAVFAAAPQAIGGRAGAYGMYENHNDYSFIIIQIVPFLYMYRKVVHGTGARLLLGAALIACMVGTLLSLSRGGMLALVLEFGLIILIGMEGRKRLLWLPVLVIVGAAAIGLQWAKRAENQGSYYTAEDAENSRMELWRAATRMVLEKPLLGVGRGLFYEYARDYGEISYDNRGKNTHNTYLEILAGTGLIGFFSFVGMLWKVIGALRRAPSSAQGPPLIDAMRRATLISFYSILFRAILDAKSHDWSFYTLCAIGLACVMLQRQAEAAGAKQTNAHGTHVAGTRAHYGPYGPY
jgi:putative inorganic carbon (HCO3(-)) transporter